MPGNDLFRAPRLLVLANGAPVAGAIAAHVTSTGWHGADTFSVRAATSGDPRLTPAFWAQATDIAIEVQIDLGFGFTSLIEGLADRVDLDPIQGVVHLAGRDRSAALIEARTRETFANQTASDIATLLAGRHGLAAIVTPTTTPVGRYWQLEHDRITLDQFSRATTEWDLLVGLADREGFDVWVRGSALYFQPRASVVAAEAVLRPVATVNGPANVTALRLERAHTLARDIALTVNSWSSKMGKGFAYTARSSGNASSASPQDYQFVLPDLTVDVAQRIAQTRLAELVAHERVVIAEMPGEVFLDAHAMLRVEGTLTDFDQDYRIDEISRSIDPRAGFRQTVRARGASAGVTVQ